tara:strand:+ start:234 stop:344 length:111 start_codon:yes stop_codon:yes gene_type:complete
MLVFVGEKIKKRLVREYININVWVKLNQEIVVELNH